MKNEILDIRKHPTSTQYIISCDGKTYSYTVGNTTNGHTTFCSTYTWDNMAVYYDGGIFLTFNSVIPFDKTNIKSNVDRMKKLAVLK